MVQGRPSPDSVHPSKHAFPSDADTQSYAQSLDKEDPLRSFRKEFIFPTKTSLKGKPLERPTAVNGSTEFSSPSNSDEAIYLCGNSLGLQPARTASYIQAHLSAWSSLVVGGHFKTMENSPLKEPWQALPDVAAKQTCPLVGAKEGEVAIANTLTVNLHLLMASFYRPTAKRNKILFETRAFPSDHVSLRFA